MKTAQEKNVLEILETQQYASVDELATALCVSTSTIRRTLEILQQKGLVTRTHGGVKINSDNNFSPSFTFRIHQNTFEKKKIAFSGDVFINIKGLTPEQAEYNKYAPILMNAVDTDRSLAAMERDFVKKTMHGCKVFGSHGCPVVL